MSLGSLGRTLKQTGDQKRLNWRSCCRRLWLPPLAESGLGSLTGGGLTLCRLQSPGGRAQLRGSKETMAGTGTCVRREGVLRRDWRDGGEKGRSLAGGRRPQERRDVGRRMGEFAKARGQRRPGVAAGFMFARLRLREELGSDHQPDHSLGARPVPGVEAPKLPREHANGQRGDYGVDPARRQQACLPPALDRHHILGLGPGCECQHDTIAMAGGIRRRGERSGPGVAWWR